LFRVLAYQLQADHLGDLDAESQRLLDRSVSPEDAGQRAVDLARRTADLRPGTVLAREWNGQMHRVAVLTDGFGLLLPPPCLFLESLKPASLRLTGSADLSMAKPGHTCDKRNDRPDDT
jgi:hypothetical protein